MYRLRKARKMSYSYNPADVGEFGLNRMRFELGDVFVAEPEKTAYLTDEEITAVLDSSSSWKHAKLRLIETLLFRFSFLLAFCRTRSKKMTAAALKPNTARCRGRPPKESASLIY